MTLVAVEKPIRNAKLIDVRLSPEARNLYKNVFKMCDTVQNTFTKKYTLELWPVCVPQKAPFFRMDASSLAHVSTASAP